MSDTYLPLVLTVDRDKDREGVSANDPGNASSLEVVEYIAAMAGDLSGMARVRRLTVLAYLLDMAAVEAQTIARAQGR